MSFSSFFSTWAAWIRRSYWYISGKKSVAKIRVFDTLTICTIPSRSETYLFVAKLVSQLKSHIVKQ
jgi:hypothetical protein